MTEEEFQSTLQSQYPDIWAIINQPGVYDVVRSAIDQNWPSNKMLVALEQTPYWQNTSDTARQWNVVKATDPATAKRKGDEQTRNVLSAAAQLGVTLTPDQQWILVSNALSGAWDAQAIKYNLLASINGYDAGGIAKAEGAYQGGGSVGQSAAAIRGLASDYGVPMSDKAVLDFAIQQQQGILDEQAIRGNLIEQAKSLFGGNEGIDQALDRGLTVRQITDPYWAIAQNELGIDPTSINLTDPQWMKAIHQVDPKTGLSAPMELSDWTATLRSDPTYGYDKTEKARTQSANLQAQLAQMMGAVG